MTRLALLATGIVVAALATGAALGADGQGKGNGASAAKTTTTNYPVKVIFLDRTGDGIMSDGKGAYTDGTDGVTAQLQVTSTGGTVASNQFLLKFGAVRGKYPRSIFYDYTHPVATSCDGTPGDNPVGTMNDTGYADVLNITTISSSQPTLAKQGGFHTAAGTFRFADATKLDPVNPYHCGDLFVVTRTSATTWTVTTDVVPGQTYYDTAGTPVFTANPEEVGSIAQLDNDAVSGQPLIGNYRMPFFLTISCVQASNCPAFPQ